MKKFFLSCLLLMVSSFLFQCNELKNKPEPVPIANLNQKEASLPNLPNDNVRASKLKEVYDYSKSKNYITKKGKNVTVTPIYYINGKIGHSYGENKRPSQFLQSYDFLIVDKNNKKNASLIYKYVPSKATSKDNFSFSNFTGYMFIEDMKHEFIEGAECVNGKQVRYLQKSDSKKGKTNCENIIWWNEYERWCDENGENCSDWQLVSSTPIGCADEQGESDGPINEGGGGGDSCENCAECNDMAALVNEEPSMIGEVESYQLNDLGGGSREAILRVLIATHSVYDLYSNPKVVIVPDGAEHLKFQSIEDGDPYVLTKKSFVVTNEVKAQNVNHNSFATLIFNGTVYVTFNLAITCSVPPFEGTVGPFIDPHKVNNVRKDINPYMF